MIVFEIIAFHLVFPMSESISKIVQPFYVNSDPKLLSQTKATRASLQNLPNPISKLSPQINRDEPCWTGRLTIRLVKFFWLFWIWHLLNIDFTGISYWRDSSWRDTGGRDSSWRDTGGRDTSWRDRTLARYISSALSRRDESRQNRKF